MLVAGGFLLSFIWAVKNGQYEDTFSPSVRMLFENRKAETGTEKPEEKTNTIQTQINSNNNKYVNE